MPRLLGDGRIGFQCGYCRRELILRRSEYLKRMGEAKAALCCSIKCRSLLIDEKCRESR